MPLGVFGPGWQLVARGTSGGAASIGPVDIDGLWDMLTINYIITGYGGGGDIAAFRFNNDSGANYWDRHISAAAASTTLTNVQNASTTMIRVASASTQQGRSGTFQVTNFRTTSKIVAIMNQTGSGAAATIPVIELVAGGEWVNTSAQINRVTMLTAAGGALNTGSGFAVFGCNIA